MANLEGTYSWMNRRAQTLTFTYRPAGPVFALDSLELPHGSVDAESLSEIETGFESRLPEGVPTAAALSIKIRLDLWRTAGVRGYDPQVNDLIPFLLQPVVGSTVLDLGASETGDVPLGHYVRLTISGPGITGTKVLFEGIQDAIDVLPIEVDDATGAEVVELRAKGMLYSMATMIPIDHLARRIINVAAPTATRTQILQSIWKYGVYHYSVINGSFIDPNRERLNSFEVQEIYQAIEDLFAEFYAILTRQATAVVQLHSGFGGTSSSVGTPFDLAVMRKWGGTEAGLPGQFVAATYSASQDRLQFAGRIDAVVAAFGDTIDESETIDDTAGFLVDREEHPNMVKTESVWDFLKRSTEQCLAKVMIWSEGSDDYPTADMIIQFAPALDNRSPVAGTLHQIDRRDLGPPKRTLNLRGNLIRDFEAGYPEGDGDQVVNAERTRTQRTESDQGGNVDLVLHNRPNLATDSDDLPYISVGPSGLERWGETGDYEIIPSAKLAITGAPMFSAQLFYNAHDGDGDTPTGFLDAAVTNADPVSVLIHPAVGFDLGPYTWEHPDPGVILQNADGSSVASAVQMVVALKNGLQKVSWGRCLGAAAVAAFGRRTQWSVDGVEIPIEYATPDYLGNRIRMMDGGVSVGPRLWVDDPALDDYPLEPFIVNIKLKPNDGIAVVDLVGIERTAP
jgi:hypothetical protein